VNLRDHSAIPIRKLNTALDYTDLPTQGNKNERRSQRGNEAGCKACKGHCLMYAKVIKGYSVIKELLCSEPD